MQSSNATILVLLFAACFTLSGFSLRTDPATAMDPEIGKAEEEALGIWISDNGNEKFEIYRRDDKFFGRIIWTNHKERHGVELIDSNNPDPEQRGRPVVGMEILYDFHYRGNGTYTNGRVYDPGSGNTYKCRIKVEGNTAKVRGYILMPLLGRTETAHRVLD